MKILIMNHYTSPPSIYTGNRHSKFAKYLTQYGHKVNLLCASTYQKGKRNMINDSSKYLIENSDQGDYIIVKARNYAGNGFKRVLNMFDYFFNSIRVTKRLVKSNIIPKPDVIYASSVHPLTLVSGIRLSEYFKVPCVCEVRDLWPLTLIELGRLKEKSIIARLLYYLEKWIYKKADRLVFNMKGGKDYISDMKWDNIVPLEKVYDLNNHIDLDTHNINLSKYKLDDPDLNSNTKKVIYVGSIGKANNVRKIVETASLIKKYQKDVEFLIYGDGPQKANIEKYVKENDIENVKFKGRVPKEHVPYILSQGYITIFTGNRTKLLRYGMSLNKLFDYLASGKPIISDIPCAYDLIAEYNCGITVQDESVQSLADAISSLINMPESEYSVLSKNAHELSKIYDTREMTKKLVQILDFES